MTEGIAFVHSELTSLIPSNIKTIPAKLPNNIVPENEVFLRYTEDNDVWKEGLLLDCSYEEFQEFRKKVIEKYGKNFETVNAMAYGLNKEWWTDVMILSETDWWNKRIRA